MYNNDSNKFYKLERKDTICKKCGKVFIYVGDTHNIKKGQEPWCTCNDKPIGWICPKCGRCNSPDITTCPCFKRKYEINKIIETWRKT